MYVVRQHKCMHVCMYVCTYVCIYLCMYECLCAPSHTTVTPRILFHLVFLPPTISQVFHRILKDLEPPRTLKIVLPSRREANFQDFALLLLHRFFINFRVHFSMDFGTIFAPRSLQHGLQNLNKKCSDPYQLLIMFNRFL